MNQVFVIIRISPSTLKSETVKVCFSEDYADYCFNYLCNLDRNLTYIKVSITIKEEIMEL